VWVRNISLEILCFISDEQTIKISQAFTQKDEVQNDVMFSGELGQNLMTAQRTHPKSEKVAVVIGCLQLLMFCG